MKKRIAEIVLMGIIWCMIYVSTYGILSLWSDMEERSRARKAPRPRLIDSLTINCVRCGWENTTYLYDSTAFKMVEIDTIKNH